LVVGETTVRLTILGKKAGQLARKAETVQKTYPHAAIVQILVTHYASPEAVAREQGILVVRSFEW